MNIEAAAREIVPVPNVDTTAGDGFERRIAAEAIAEADKRREEVAAILRKHFPARPKLIESGPLPEGKVFVAFPKKGVGVTQPVAIIGGAPNPNYAAFDVYDFGPDPRGEP